jgi:hypothetical protein
MPLVYRHQGAICLGNGCTSARNVIKERYFTKEAVSAHGLNQPIMDINIKILLASVSPNLRATGRLPLRKNVKEKPAGAAAMALRE